MHPGCARGQDGPVSANDDADEPLPAPPETASLWLDAIATMDAEVLESFTTRTRRFWRRIPAMADNWNERTPFDRMLDEIASAQSVREVDHLLEMAKRELAGHPRFDQLERAGAAIRRMLSVRRAPDA